MAEDRIVEAGGSRLAVRWLRPTLDVASTPIVLLHEALGCIELWRSFPERLATATGRPVLVYDRTGHGRSSPLGEARGLDYLHRLALDELPELLAACEIQRPILVGHSDGATIAALYAAHRPAAALVVEAIHVLVEPETVAGVSNAGERRDWLIERLGKYHGKQAPALVAAWADTWCAEWFRTWNVVSELKTINCPVLAIQGLDDQYGTVRQVAELGAVLATPFEQLMIDGCGHSPHHEAETTVLSAIVRFLADID